MKQATLSPAVPTTVSILPEAFEKAPFALLRDLSTQYGDFVRIRIGPQVIYLTTNPDDFQHILRDRNTNFAKSKMLYEAAKLLIGNSLFTSTGDFWLRQRRMIQPHMHRKKLAGFTDIMVGAVNDSLSVFDEKIKRGEIIDIKTMMAQVTIDIITQTMFGRNTLTKEESELMYRSLRVVADHVALRGYLFVIPTWMPIPGQRKFDESMAHLRSAVHDIIDMGMQRREMPENTLLDILIGAFDEDTNERMTADQLFDETMTVFSAGFETTATALTWTMLLLDENPEIAQAMRDEVDQAIGNRTLTFEDLHKMPLCRMVFAEAMRLYPPIPVLPRTAMEDDHIRGHHIPANTTVLLGFYGLHHNPAVWDDPETFDPQRFSPEQSKGRHQFAYLPFSGGPRKCVGNEFALMEGVLTLAMVMQRYNIRLLNPESIHPRVSSTLAVSEEVSAHLTLR